jgi:hypothetical protein
MALKEQQKLEKELTGYVEWICRAGNRDVTGCRCFGSVILWLAGRHFCVFWSPFRLQTGTVVTPSKLHRLLLEHLLIILDPLVIILEPW